MAAECERSRIAVGAALPLLPFLFGHAHALAASISLTGLDLFAIGTCLGVGLA